MHNTKKIAEELYWVGASDRRLALFENVYPIPSGVSYNSYVITDEKTALLDAADAAVTRQLTENIAHVLGGRRLDYIIINHMEPDHAASLAEVLRLWPEAVVVTNAKALNMIKQFFPDIADFESVAVKEGDTLELGRRTLTFVMAPMVHWPETMVTYDSTDGILFSADAFGTFGAISGNIFADETDFDMTEARRYYTNIVGKYGVQTAALLKKASALKINMLCPLHGPVWRENIGEFVGKYMKWSAYEPEDRAVMIAYGSVYGGTANAADILASKLADRGIKGIRVYDVSVTHPSYIVSEAFRCSHIVFASSTYNAGIFPPMETLLHEIAAHNLQNRTIALIDNGTWAATAAKQMAAILEPLKNTTILETRINIKSTVNAATEELLEKMADEIADSVNQGA